jgi:UDP-perosamine 4-acetyltransferase
MAGAILNAEARVFDLAIINTGATIDHDCTIGYAAHIAPQCALAGNVNVGSYSFLGIGTKVIPGIAIGENVTVGAGGVVVKDIADGVLAIGIPARALN